MHPRRKIHHPPTPRQSPCNPLCHAPIRFSIRTQLPPSGPVEADLQARQWGRGSEDDVRGSDEQRRKVGCRGEGAGEGGREVREAVVGEGEVELETVTAAATLWG